MTRDWEQDSLDGLLREADAAAPPPPVPQPGLAERVRRRRQAHVRRQLAAAVVALPAAALALSLALPPARKTPPNGDVAQLNATEPANRRRVPTRATDDPQALTAEVLRLKSEAAIRLSVVEGLQKRHARREIEARVAELESRGLAPDSAGLERDKAALTLIDHGDRLRKDFQAVDEALAAYRRAIELFPDTRWAAVAKQRIDSLQIGASVGNTNPSFS